GQIQGVTFSPDGTALLTWGADCTALLWNISSGMAGAVGADCPRRENLDRLWAVLGDKNLLKARRAASPLATCRTQALPFLVEKLRAKALLHDRIEHWIRDLDSSRFAIRDQATRGLGKSGRWAGPSLRRAVGCATTLEGGRRIEQMLARIEASETL